MSFLVSIIKPLAYVSLPVFLLRFVASTSPMAGYIIRSGLYAVTLGAAGVFGFFSSLGMSLVGQTYNVNWVVARAFYAVASTVLGVTVEMDGEEHMQTRPAVFVSNHQSMFDILMLGRFFPKQTSIMSKKELQWSPLGPFMSMSGTVFIDRGNSAKAQRSLEAAGEEMKARSTSLFVYPEGTRHSAEEPDLLPFKKGAFRLAVQAGLPIVPVVTENYWRIYHGGLFDYGVVKVRVLPPIPTANLTAADVSDLALRVRDQMLDALRDISVKVSPSGRPNKSDDPTSATSRDPAAVSEEQEVPESPPSEPIPVGRETKEERRTASVSSSSEASASPTRQARMEGSENGAETEEDEGMVLVGRPS